MFWIWNLERNSIETNQSPAQHTESKREQQKKMEQNEKKMECVMNNHVNYFIWLCSVSSVHIHGATNIKLYLSSFPEFPEGLKFKVCENVS